LTLIDDAVAAGWSHRRACAAAGVGARRARRWAARRGAGALDDRRPGAAVHGLLDWEAAEIRALFAEFGELDGSHRKLAHRGSYERRVWVSESTVLRVLAAEGLVLPARPRPAPTAKTPWPDWVELRPRQVWGYDVTHFPRAKRAVIAILDLVSRKWVHHLVSTEETSTEVAAVFTAALDAEGLLVAGLAVAGSVPIDVDDHRRPILLAVSDNGPQMTSGSTREFMALHAIARHFGRPGTPTDQAPIESFFGHVKTEWPHLTVITDPAELVRELYGVRDDYNGRRLHAAIGYVTPDDEHEGRGADIRRARRQGLTWARRRRIAYHRKHRNKPPS
jgi:transposase InsO family protein